MKNWPFWKPKGIYIFDFWKNPVTLPFKSAKCNQTFPTEKTLSTVLTNCSKWNLTAEMVKILPRRISTSCNKAKIEYSLGLWPFSTIKDLTRLSRLDSIKVIPQKWHFVNQNCTDKVKKGFPYEKEKFSCLKIELSVKKILRKL